MIHLNILTMALRSIYDVYAVINASDLDKIDYSQVSTTSRATTKYNIAKTELITSWNTTPTFISNGSVTPVSTMNHADAVELDASADWSIPA